MPRNLPQTSIPRGTLSKTTTHKPMQQPEIVKNPKRDPVFRKSSPGMFLLAK